jgi:O-acetylserine/cysteine efflux transporter
MNQKTIALCLFVVAVWGANVVAIRAGVQEMESLTFLAIRFACTSLIFLPFIRWPGRRQAWIMVQIGILMGVLHQGFLYAGLEHTDAGTMSILLQAQVLLVTLIGWLFLKETIGWRTWTGILLGVAGIAILFGGPSLAGDPRGFIYGLLSALFIAICYVRMKALNSAHPLTFIAIINLSAALPMLLISWLSSPESWQTITDYNWVLLGSILSIQVFVLSTTHVIWQRLLVTHPVSQITPWTLLMPIFGVVFAYLLLGEEISLQMIIGGALTISGVGIVMLRRIQKGNSLPVEPID